MKIIFNENNIFQYNISKTALKFNKVDILLTLFDVFFAYIY